jgi:hypothetical protein
MVVWYGIYILYIYTGINIGQDTGINEVYIQYIYSANQHRNNRY